MILVAMCQLLSATGRRVGQQGDLTGVLDRDGHVTLVLDAVAGHPTGADLAAVRDELAEQRGVLVVDTGRLLLAELANLLLGLANHCLGHCGASFREARLAPEWLRCIRMVRGWIRTEARRSPRRERPTGRCPQEQGRRRPDGRHPAGPGWPTGRRRRPAGRP